MRNDSQSFQPTYQSAAATTPMNTHTSNASNASNASTGRGYENSRRETTFRYGGNAGNENAEERVMYVEGGRGNRGRGDNR